MQIILNHTQTQQKITRIGHELIENCFEEPQLFIGGIIGNGFELARRLCGIIEKNSSIKVTCFEIAIDKNEPWNNSVELSIEQEKLKKGYIILVDDVINSGKTLQYALVKFLEQPTKAIKTVVLVDRKHRRYPVKANFVGLSLSTTLQDRVEVDFTKGNTKAFLV
jgi:pyrimidine operon attenuation protein/uracil phosphoribosyltransferase